LGNLSKTAYIFSIIAILFVSFSNIPDAEAKDLSIDTDCIDGILVITITDKEGNPLSNVRVGTTDSISERNPEEKFYTEMDGKVTIDSSSNLGYVSISKGGYNDKSIATPCEKVEVSLNVEKQKTDLYIVKHWSFAGGWFIEGYGDVSSTIIGDIVNLSDNPITNILISVRTIKNGIVDDTSSWYPIKKILRPGEASPFVITPALRGFDGYEIWIRNYEFTNTLPNPTSPDITEITLDRSADYWDGYTVKCGEDGGKSARDTRENPVSFILIWYNENNNIESIEFESFEFPSKDDCKRYEGTVFDFKYSDIPLDNSFEFFIIDGFRNLLYNEQEVAKITTAYKTSSTHVLKDTYSLYYPDSLRPKYMNLDEIRTLAEKRDIIQSSETVHKEVYDENSIAIESLNHQGTVSLKNEKYWDAITWFDNTLELDPDNRDALYNKALALEALGLDNDAKVLFDRVKQLESSPNVPDWIRNNAKWWSEGAIGDSDFTSGIQFMIKENIMIIPDLPEEVTQMELKDEKRAMGMEREQNVPDWVRNNAGWWADGLISDDDFVKGIQYLVEQGIIQV